MIGEDRKAVEYFQAVVKRLLDSSGNVADVSGLANHDDFDWNVLHGVLKKNIVILRTLEGVDLKDEKKWGRLARVLEVEKKRVQGGLLLIKQLGRKLDQLGIRYAIIEKSRSELRTDSYKPSPLEKRILDVFYTHGFDRKVFSRGELITAIQEDPQFKVVKPDSYDGFIAKVLTAKSPLSKRLVIPPLI